MDQSPMQNSPRHQEAETFWGYGTGYKTPTANKNRPSTTKNRNSNTSKAATDHKKPFNYNRRVTQLAASKLRELLDTEKEIQYKESQIISMPPQTMKNRRNKAFALSQTNFLPSTPSCNSHSHTKSAFQQGFNSSNIVSSEFHDVTQPSTNNLTQYQPLGSKKDYTYSSHNLSQKLRLVGDLHPSQEMTQVFSIRNNPEKIWGAQTNLTQNAMQASTPQEAATQNFYDQQKGSNSLLKNIEARRRMQFTAVDEHAPQVKDQNQGSSIFKRPQSQQASMRRKIPAESIILDFQQEYLRHKRIVCQLTRLQEFYFDLDVQYHRTFGDVFGIDYINGTNHMRKRQGTREKYQQNVKDVLDLIVSQHNEKLKEEAKEAIKHLDRQTIQSQVEGNNTVEGGAQPLDPKETQAVGASLVSSGRGATSATGGKMLYVDKQMKEGILKELQEQMEKFTDFSPFTFGSKEEMANYFLISDSLNTVLQKKQTKLLMETEEFRPILSQVVQACKQYMNMLKDLNNDFSDAAKVKVPESKSSMYKNQMEAPKGTEEDSVIGKGTMLAYLFDCIMKIMLMLLDGVMDDREQYAKDQNTRQIRINNELEERLQKRNEAFERQIQQINEEHRQEMNALQQRIKEQITEKDAFAKEVGEYKFQLDGLMSFKRRDEHMSGIQKQIRQLEVFLGEQKIERDKQEGSIFEIMSLINIKGGCIPDFNTTASQSSFQMNVTMPQIFTEISVDRKAKYCQSLMARLCSMHKSCLKAADFEPHGITMATNQEAVNAPIKKKATNTPRNKFNKNTSMQETASIFEAVFQQKLETDTKARDTLSEISTLDELTVNWFINTFQTIELASGNMMGHLQNIYNNLENPYCQLICKIYGICGFYKPKQDIIEYFLAMWARINRTGTMWTDERYGYKSLFDQIKWLVKTFNRTPDKQPGTAQLNSLVEIGVSAISNLHKWNTPQNCYILGLEYIKPFVTPEQCHKCQHLAQAEFTHEQLNKISMGLLSIDIQMKLGSIEKGQQAVTLVSLLKAKEKSDSGRISANCVRKVLEHVQGKVKGSGLGFPVWISEDQIDAICTLIDPEGNEPQSLFPWQILQDMCVKADQTARSVQYSNIQLGLVVLDAMQEQIQLPMMNAITQRASGGLKKVNYLEFEFFRQQLKSVKASFDDVKASNMFVKSNEILLNKKENLSDLLNRAFGDTFIEEANKGQCLVGTFIDHSQPKIKGNRQGARAGSQLQFDNEKESEN